MMKRAVLLVSVGLALVGAGAPGCSTAMDADSPSVNTIITPPDAQADDGGSAPDAPAHGLAPSQVAGSPLCNASTWMGCYPDDTHVSRSSSTILPRYHRRIGMEWRRVSSPAQHALRRRGGLVRESPAYRARNATAPGGPGVVQCGELKGHVRSS